MYYGVIENTIRVIHNSNDIEEIKRNISLLNTDEKTEIITEKEYKSRIEKESENIVKQPTTEEEMLKEIANLKIDNMKKDTIINNTLKTVAELKVKVMSMEGGN